MALQLFFFNHRELKISQLSLIELEERALRVARSLKQLLRSNSSLPDFITRDTGGQNTMINESQRLKEFPGAQEVQASYFFLKRENGTIGTT